MVIMLLITIFYGVFLISQAMHLASSSQFYDFYEINYKLCFEAASIIMENVLEFLSFRVHYNCVKIKGEHFHTNFKVMV